LGEAQRLQALWQRVLAPPLTGHTHPQHYQAGCLYIHADSPAWAARLRSQQSEIVKRLRAEPSLTSLDHLQIRVVPNDATKASHVTAAPVHRQTLAVSDQTAALLRGVAEEVKDPGLRESLMRLATRRAPARKA
jgi:hypothetical protein